MGTFSGLLEGIIGRRRRKRRKQKRKQKKIVAKASDGQRYPLSLSKCMLDMEMRGAAAPKEPMTYDGLGFEH